MNKVLVAYYPMPDPLGFPDTVFVMRHLTRGSIEGLREALDDPKTTGVALIGPSVAYGWRVRTPREVEFVSRPTLPMHDADQRQASMRIVGGMT